MNKKFITVFLSFFLLLIGAYKLAHELKSIDIFKAISVGSFNDKKSTEQYQGKRWLTLGDSITKANGYQSRLKDMLDFSVIDNEGINGQTMAYQTKNKSTYTIGKDIDYKNYDLVTIFIGTNDFRYNKKLGEIKNKKSDSFDEKTFTGSYQLLIEHIFASNPDIKLALITPPQRTRDGYDINFTNEVGYKLIDYVNTTEKLGEMYSIPVLNLYSTSGITTDNIDIYTRDGLHPNDKGYDLIAKKIYEFLLNV